MVQYSCGEKKETISPTEAPVTESVYAVGVIKSANQYQSFAMANGVIENIFVKEGDTVLKGMPLISITNDIQRLNRENAMLTAQFSDIQANQAQLEDALGMIKLQENKVESDSLMWARQNNLWKQNIGSKVDLERSELAFKNSKTAFKAAQNKYKELKRQLNLTSQQSKNNLKIVSNQENDFLLKSDIDGIVYKIYKKKGEAINPQVPLALIGAKENFILEMQVDEYDIFKIAIGQKVLVTMDSYKGKVFEAIITTIAPVMTESSKSFKVEAEFTKGPKKLYPFVTFEANIILHTKAKALMIPKNYLINDSLVVKENGDTVKVEIGLSDYQRVEILSGISKNDVLLKPE
jgi:HlyD family secretion protein